MISRLTATALASVLALAGGLAPAVAVADEASELREAVTALQKRLDQLEAKAKDAEDTNDRQTDLIAKTRNGIGSWVGNFTWRGDLRYRNESIDQEFTKDRNRDRIRLRTGFLAKVNDTVRAEVQIATSEGADPRSQNQTLTGENILKPINLTLAYAEWQPNANWKLTVGKQKYPWARPGQSVLFDSDINPEGVAVNFTHGPFFAAAFYTDLEERALQAESTMAGGQAGWRGDFGTSRLTFGASYFSFNAVQGKNPFYNASSNGNTTTTVGTICQAVSPCLRYGYQLIEGFAEFATVVAGRPLSAHLDYFKNNDADNGLDQAYSAGLLYGRASDPRTWEIGYVYQHIDKDSLYAQYIDSDFAGGITDTEGSIIKFAYAPARNWTINGTYFLNQTNLDVPVTIAGQGSVRDRDYKRLQLDLNFRF